MNIGGKNISWAFEACNPFPQTAIDLQVFTPLDLASDLQKGKGEDKPQNPLPGTHRLETSPAETNAYCRDAGSYLNL